MNLRLSLKNKDRVFIAALSLVLFFLSGCRHEERIYQEKVTTFPDKTRNCSSFSVVYDEQNSSLLLSKQEWIRVEEKIVRTDTGMVSRSYYGTPCSDAWMRCSLWNGEPRKNLMLLAIPPLTVYPIIDTVILTGCFAVDCIIFPVVYIANCGESDRMILPDQSEKGQKKEIVSELRMDRNMAYRDANVNRTSIKYSSRPFLLKDGSIQKKFYTDAQGVVKISDIIPFLLPVRNISLQPDENATSSDRNTFSTYQFLNPDQKKQWDTVKKFGPDKKRKLKAWEKLEPVCEPAYYKKIKSNLDLGFYF